MVKTKGSVTGVLVLSALKKLTKNTGWTTRTIAKFIRMEYRIQDPKISRKISRALKRGVKLGLLRMDGGRYRLNNISRLSRVVDKSEMRSCQRYKMEPSLRVYSRSSSSM